MDALGAALISNGTCAADGTVAAGNPLGKFMDTVSSQMGPTGRMQGSGPNLQMHHPSSQHNMNPQQWAWHMEQAAVCIHSILMYILLMFIRPQDKHGLLNSSHLTQHHSMQSNNNMWPNNNNMQSSNNNIMQEWNKLLMKFDCNNVMNHGYKNFMKGIR